ncbi:MAG: hypothetical protein GY707_01875 [Desulfobacteraceae bacterium]|nr:hypothetical protein [Desulfobacteraceae bacterium]
MKNILILIAVTMMFLLGACGSYQLNPNQLNVTVNDNIMADKRKSRAIEKHRVEHLLFKYMKDLAIAYEIRNSLIVETTVTRFYIGRGKDFLGAETIVRENGKEIAKFFNQRATGKRPAVKRMAITLARDILARVKRL